MKLFIIIFRDLLLLSNGKNEKYLILNNYFLKYDKILNKFSNANFEECIQTIERTNNYINQNGYFPLLMSSLNIEINRNLNNKNKQTFII